MVQDAPRMLAWGFPELRFGLFRSLFERSNQLVVFDEYTRHSLPFTTCFSKRFATANWLKCTN